MSPVAQSVQELVYRLDEGISGVRLPAGPGNFCSIAPLNMGPTQPRAKRAAKKSPSGVIRLNKLKPQFIY